VRLDVSHAQPAHARAGGREVHGLLLDRAKPHLARDQCGNVVVAVVARAVEGGEVLPVVEIP